MAENVMITIDMDKRCEECGKAGASPSGLCIGCFTDVVTGKRMKSPAGRAVASRMRKQKPARSGVRRG